MTKSCRNCIYHQPCPFWGEGLCDNPSSVYYEHYTQDKAHCAKWAGWELKDEWNKKIKFINSVLKGR